MSSQASQRCGEIDDDEKAPMWLTTHEVASQLRVPEPTVRKLCRRGALPGVRIGKPWRIPADYAKHLSAS